MAVKILSPFTRSLISPVCTLLDSVSIFLSHISRGSRGGGDRGSGPPPPPWNLKILPKKRLFRDFWGIGPPPPVTKNYHFRWTPSHENFWMQGGPLLARTTDCVALAPNSRSRLIYSWPALLCLQASELFTSEFLLFFY